MGNEKYPYAEGNLIENPNTYQYSKYHGMPFLSEWLKQRKVIKSELGAPETPPKPSGRYPFNFAPVMNTETLFEDIFQGIVSLTSQSDDELKRYLKLLVKRFEFTKRVYKNYDDQLKPVDKNDYKEIKHYLRLAEIMATAYANNKDLTYLNALLKLDDILIAHRAELMNDQASRMSWVIEREIEHVTDRAKECGVNLCF